jgi:hypothetical protein
MIFCMFNYVVAVWDFELVFVYCILVFEVGGHFCAVWFLTKTPPPPHTHTNAKLESSLYIAPFGLFELGCLIIVQCPFNTKMVKIMKA